MPAPVVRLLGALPFVLLHASLTSCATPTPGARPDDMSAVDHDSAAAAERAEARVDDARFDPEASRGRLIASPLQDSAGSSRFSTYNPTQRHRTAAQKHTEHARQHAAAAAELRAFEESECADISASARAECPLWPVERVEDIRGGARLSFTPDTQLEAELAHLRCHLAFARTTKYEGMQACPIFGPGVAIVSSEDGTSVDVTITDDAKVPALRASLRAFAEH